MAPLSIQLAATRGRGMKAARGAALRRSTSVIPTIISSKFALTMATTANELKARMCRFAVLSAIIIQ